MVNVITSISGMYTRWRFALLLVLGFRVCWDPVVMPVVWFGTYTYKQYGELNTYKELLWGINQRECLQCTRFVVELKGGEA